jgi:hypothetical protein
MAADSPERAMRWRTAVACVALTVPLALLATAPAHPLDPKPAGEQVRHVTEVKRIVRVETKRVKVPQQMAAASVRSNPEVVAAKPAGAVWRAPRRTTPRTTARRSPSTRTATPSTPAADPKPSAGEGSTATQQPAATGTTPQP